MAYKYIADSFDKLKYQVVLNDKTKKYNIRTIFDNENDTIDIYKSYDTKFEAESTIKWFKIYDRRNLEIKKRIAIALGEHINNIVPEIIKIMLKDGEK